MEKYKKILYRIIIGAILGIGLGFLIDYLWSFAADEYLIIKLDAKSEFLGGILTIFTLPSWIFYYTPLAWGIIGSLLGYYGSSKSKLYNIFIFFCILLILGMLLGYQIMIQA